MERLKTACLIETLKMGIVKKVRLTEIALALYVKMTQLSHLLVKIQQMSLTVIKRHGHKTRIENLHIPTGQFLVMTFVFHLTSNILDRIDNIAGTTML